MIKHKYTSVGNVLKPVDLSRIIQYFVVDAITDIAFREPFGMLHADDDVNGMWKGGDGGANRAAPPMG